MKLLKFSYEDPDGSTVTAVVPYARIDAVELRTLHDDSEVVVIHSTGQSFEYDPVGNPTFAEVIATLQTESSS